MARISLEEFAGEINKIIPVIMRESMRGASGEFYRVKVTMPQFMILSLLAREGRARMTDAARHMNVTTAAMTGIMDRLVRDGYAARGRDPEDRRVVWVRATPKAQKAVAKITLERRKAIMNIFSKVSQEDREEYLRILMRIRDHIAA